LGFVEIGERIEGRYCRDNRDVMGLFAVHDDGGGCDMAVEILAACMVHFTPGSEGELGGDQREGAVKRRVRS
jgi:hypothetical protein